MAREAEPEPEARRRSRESRALAAERDRQVRVRSVVNDTRLNLPVAIPMPEEFPRTSPMQLRSHDQRAEIVRGYVQGPPNRTIANNCSPADCTCDHSGSPGPWTALWKAGKSPPSRSKCSHHSRPANSKGKPKLGPNSSSTCSSGGSKGTSITEKFHTFFEKAQKAPKGPSPPAPSPPLSVMVTRQSGRNGGPKGPLPQSEGPGSNSENHAMYSRARGLGSSRAPPAPSQDCPYGGTGGPSDNNGNASSRTEGPPAPNGTSISPPSASGSQMSLEEGQGFGSSSSMLFDPPPSPPDPSD